jgi:tetratricopeptide (TPR) repeat protein
LAWLDWATILAPEDDETAFLRARAYRRLGDMNRSKAAINRAFLAKASRERLTREEWLCDAQSGQMQNIEQQLNQLWNDPRGDLDEIREALFLGCVKSGRHDDALQILDSWIAEHRNHARPYLQRARFWELKSKMRKALEDLQQAMELEPQNAEVAVELATLHERRNEFELAIPLFERGLKVPRLAVQADIGLAVCLKTIGDTGRVRPLLDNALKQDPQNPKVLCESGRYDLETGHYSDAVTKLTKAVGIAPRDDECHSVLGQSLAALGRWDEAKRHFDFVQTVRDDERELDRCDALLKRNPRNIGALVSSGAIHLRSDVPENGVNRLMTALSIEPNHTGARKLLADHFARLAEANPEYRKLAELFRVR